MDEVGANLIFRRWIYKRFFIAVSAMGTGAVVLRHLLHGDPLGKIYPIAPGMAAIAAVVIGLCLLRDRRWARRCRAEREGADKPPKEAEGRTGAAQRQSRE